MKKIISIIICSIILLSATATVCFANAYTNGFELEDYGQLHYYIPEGTTVPPVADGKVSEDEYSLQIMGIYPNYTDDEADNRFFIVDDYDDTEYVNIYVDYDKDNIYFAMEIKDNYVGESEKAYFDVGLGPSISDYVRSKMYFKNENGEPEVSPYNGDNQELADEGYFTAYTASYDEENELFTYEISYSRSKLAEYFYLDSFDKIYLRAIASMYTQSGKAGEAWFGFQSNALIYYHYIMFYRYPHVIHFTEAPLIEAETDTEDTSDTIFDDTSEQIGKDEGATTDANNNQDLENVEDLIKDTDETSDAEMIPTTGAITDNKIGCASSVTAVSVSLILSLGVCAIITKRK